MQCKDICTKSVLLFLKQISPHWGTCYPGFNNSVTHAMPVGTPLKLVQAKMRNLIKKGYVEGCACGCRGDYELTEKGLKELNQ